jgi:hypothetical protein
MLPALVEQSNEVYRPAPTLTFAALAALEPSLGELLAEAQEVRDDGTAEYFCQVATFFGYPGHRPGFKRRLCGLVGWFAEGADVLATRAAYDLGYETIIEALPPCRGRCGCL